MKKKKIYKLKKGVKIFLVCFIILTIAGVFSFKKIEEYMYTQTYEYKFLALGYTKDNYELFSSKLNNQELDKLLEYEYNEFIPEFINCQYFIFANLDSYLSQVITQEDDFFKYHGTEGYDYDYLVSLTNTKAINPHYENTLNTNLDDNYSMLVNKFYQLPADYIPEDLVSIDWKYRLGDANDYKYARVEVVDAFLEMWEAAYNEGIYLLVDSAYRSYERQSEVYKSYEDSKGTKFADSIAARPGYSEHQTGLTLDIYSKECTLASEFKNSKTYAWLIANSYKYGFILRYPERQEKITGYNYESWHYRYLGRDLAKKVYESNLTYDEYYAFYLNK